MIQKDKLLNYGLFVDNLYLDQYIDLINANLTRLYKKGETNVHHVIPLWYYQYIDNTLTKRSDRIKRYRLDRNNFTVNLIYKDHLLAHWLLYKCSKSEIVACSQIQSMTLLLAKIGYRATPDIVMAGNFDFDNIQSIYQKYKLAQIKPKKETDFIWIHKNLKNKKVKKTDIASLNKFLAEGWQLGYFAFKYVNNYIESKKVPTAELANYLQAGWRMGKL